jgi:RHS repeat-associated protein
MTYDAASRLVTSTLSGVTTTYTFDVSGNMTNVVTGAETVAMTYTKENQMATHSDTPGVSTELSYDGVTGFKRSTNFDFSGPKDLYWDENDVAYNEDTVLAVGIRHYIVGGVTIGTYAGSRQDFLVDYLGSVTGSSDSAGNATSSVRYKPYGGTLAGTVSTELGWTGNTGSMPTGNKFAEQYNRARHVSTLLKQCTTRDPIWPDELPYGYVDQNPVSAIDPTGMHNVSRPGKPCPKGTLLIRPSKGDPVIIAVDPGGGTLTPSECIAMAKKLYPGKNCTCVNGGFFNPATGDTVSPVVTPGRCKDGISIDPIGLPPFTFIPPESGVPPRPWIPITCPGGGGSVCGRPLDDPSFGPTVPDARTAACVSRSGEIQFIIAVPNPPGATAAGLSECLASQGCAAPSRMVLLDGGGSTQVISTGPGKKPPTVISDDPGGMRPVHNWIIVCDK